MSSHPLFDIGGKKALVTGGTRGLGFSLAEGLLEAGCQVCIIGSAEKSVAGALAALGEKGFRCAGVWGDLSEPAQTLRTFQAGVEKLGGDLDILVVSHGIQCRYPGEAFPEEDWNRVIQVNLNSVFLLNREAARLMLPKGYGKIINIASMTSWFGGKNIAAYTASKGGVMQLTKALSNDWLGRGIHVNAIAPGYMETDLNRALSQEENPERFRQITQRIPAGRWGTGEDLKGACIFLASHASDYLGGAIIPVDGGYLSC